MILQYKSSKYSAVIFTYTCFSESPYEKCNFYLQTIGPFSDKNKKNRQVFEEMVLLWKFDY